MKLTTQLKRMGYHRDVIPKGTTVNEIVFKKYLKDSFIKIFYKEEKIVDYEILFKENKIDEQIIKIVKEEIKEIKKYEN